MADTYGADVSAGDLRGSNQPLTVCDWAVNGGVDGFAQRLEVDMRPLETRVAKTRAATGRSLLSNGALGADLLHVPAGEGFAPHTHPSVPGQGFQMSRRRSRA